VSGNSGPQSLLGSLLDEFVVAHRQPDQDLVHLVAAEGAHGRVEPVTRVASAVSWPFVATVHSPVVQLFAQLADLYDVPVAPHNFYGPLADLMSAHSAAAIPNFRIMEIEANDVPWKSDLLTVPPRIEDGTFALPSTPGWGSDINEAAVDNYQVVTWFADRNATVEQVLPDNDSAYKSHALRDACAELGITPKRTRPHGPPTDEKIERFHRTLGDGWAYGRFYASDTELQPWLHQYNHHRLHSAIGNKPPLSHLINLPGQYN